MSRPWPDGWWGIDDPEHRRIFLEELVSEVDKGHMLYGLNLKPVARADGRDDYLFEVDDGRVAEVHLTFANKPERPPWPGTALYESLAVWMKEKNDERA